MSALDDWLADASEADTVIVGAGSLGIMVADALQAIDAGARLAMLDDGARVGEQRLGVSVIGGVAEGLDAIAARRAAGDGAPAVVLAVAANGFRRDTAMRHHGHVDWRTVIHPAATVSPHAEVGAGTIIMGGTVIDPLAKVGSHVVINKLCSLGHNCTMQDASQFAPAVASGGTICSGAFVGMGANVLPGVRVGVDSTVGAGAVVVRDVADGVTVTGVPARAR